MTLSSSVEYRVSAKGFNAVKKICSKITNQESRRRAFKALLCMDTLADYLYSQGFNIDISKNLYKILPLNEEFEFTDIHCNGRFIDIVPVLNGQYVLIPKNHTIFDVVPELYVVADYNQTTKKVKFLGCFEGDKIPKNVENGKYYVCDIKNMQQPAMVEELLSSVKPEELSENSHALFVSFFIDYLDGVLDDTSKKRLITHLIECKECRSELVEFFDYESIAKDTKNHPELFADNTLDIVAAVAVNAPKYKNFKEYTIPIEKQKDEYEEDEDEDTNVGGKQIKSAIEDPLQILYGKDKNKKIFDLMGERPKKTSMLDSVMSDISKETKKAKSEPLAKEELSVSYEGTINPEYYSENLPEGTDVDFIPQNDDLHLDIIETPSKSQKTAVEEDENVYEIVEENDEEPLNLSENNDFTPIQEQETIIPHSLKTDVDKPEFSAQLNPEPRYPVTASDEMLLLDEEKHVDEPEFISNKQEITEKQDENDDFITIEDDDFSVLDFSKEDNELPTSMDNVIYYDDEENVQPEKVDEKDDLLSLNFDENDDVIEILDDETNIMGAEIKLPQNEEIEEPQTVEEAPIEDNIVIPQQELEEEFDFISDDEPKTENTGVQEDSPSIAQTPETIESISDETEDEMPENELVHFDAIELDIVDENDVPFLNQQSVIPETIDEAGIAASSLIDDYEDDSKENIAKAVAKTAGIAGSVAKSVLVDKAVDVTNNIVAGAKLISNLTSSKSELDLSTKEQSNSISESNNTISINEVDNDFLVIDDEEEAHSDATIIPDNTICGNDNDDDFLIINDDESLADSITTLKNTISVDNIGSDDDFIVIDEDENNELNSFALPTNANADSDDDFVIIDDAFENNTDSSDDDCVIIDEDEFDKTQSFSISTNNEQSDDDDFVIIDADENIVETPQIATNNTDSVDNDMLVIDDEEDDACLEPESDNTNSVATSGSHNEEDLIPDVEDLHDNLLTDLPMIKKENSDSSETKPVIEDSSDDLFSFGDEDDSDLLNFDDNQDFLLSDDDDDSFVINEVSEQNEPQISEVEQKVEQIVDSVPTNDVQPQPIQQNQNDEEDDDLVIINDEDDVTFLGTSENSVNTTDNTNGVIDNNVKEKQDSDSDFEPIADDSTFDDSVNFFRPAGASFNDNNDDFLVIKDDEDEQKPLVVEDDTNSVKDESEPKSEEDRQATDVEPVDEETDDELEFMEEIGEQLPQDDAPKKPVSQLDLIFNSLSTREKEQIEAVQSGKKEETPKNTEETPKKSTSRSFLNLNVQDAILAKDEAVESGRISLSAADEPVVDPLINTTKEKIDEEEYEYEEVHSDEYPNDEKPLPDEKSSEKEEEEVEYVYEDENGNEYIPQEGEEVEYVYEDEDGNIISGDDISEDDEIVEEEDNNVATDDDIHLDDKDELPLENKEKSVENNDYEEEDFVDIQEDNHDSENDFVSQDFGEISDELPDFDDDFDQNVENHPETVDENEDDLTDVLEDEESSEEEVSEEQQNQDSKKAMIKKVAIAVAVALVLVGGGITTKVILSHNNAQSEQQALNDGATLGEGNENFVTPSAGEDGGLAVSAENQPSTESPIIGGEEDGGLSIPEADADAVLGGAEVGQLSQAPKAENTAPKAGTSNATTSDMNKAVANAFSESPSSFSVRKASWGVGASLAADTDFKTYLQKMGKSIKSKLRKNLSSLKGDAPTNPVKVQIKMTETGALQDVVILKSSGKPEVDEVVLQSVKQTVEACPFPELSANTLKANQKATGGNTVKMSLTVTF